MTANRWTEQQEAGVSGPRALNNPGSPVWCWQTISHLQTLWRSVNIDLSLYERTWAEAEEHRVWDKVPYDQPYGTKERMVEALSIGDVPAAKARARANVAMAAVRSNGADYVAARIARDAPEVWEQMKQGRYTSVAAAARAARVARDAPEVWERLKRGEFSSVEEAAAAAGIRFPGRKTTVTLGSNVDRVADRLIGHFNAEQLQRLRELLQPSTLHC